MAEVNPEALPWWGAVYKMDREARERVGGLDECTALCEGKVRRSAREAGHEPYGRVHIEWSDTDPDEPEHVHPEPLPTDKVWAIVKVQVRPDALRGDTPE